MYYDAHEAVKSTGAGRVLVNVRLEVELGDWAGLSARNARGACISRIK